MQHNDSDDLVAEANLDVAKSWTSKFCSFFPNDEEDKENTNHEQILSQGKRVEDRINATGLC